jgi:hypothetical protein
VKSFAAFLVIYFEVPAVTFSELPIKQIDKKNGGVTPFSRM